MSVGGGADSSPPARSPIQPAMLVMGFSARGGALVVRDHVAPMLGGAELSAVLLQAACYGIIPFFALRLFVCSETGDALRVHALNLALTGLLSFAGFAVYQQLA